MACRRTNRFGGAVVLFLWIGKMVGWFLTANQGAKAGAAASATFVVSVMAAAAYTDHKINSLKEDFRELKEAAITNNQNLITLQNNIIYHQKKELKEIEFKEEKPKE